jgi:Uncharacterized protein conserved in bacteria
MGSPPEADLFNMHQRRSRAPALVAGAFLFLSALPALAAGHVYATGGWLRLLPGKLPAGGYFHLYNDTDQALTLVGATSPDYGDVMLHRSIESGGQSRMVMVKRVRVPAHGQLRFAPGGYHLMLMQAKKKLSVGDSVPLFLRFANGDIMPVPLAVMGAAASGPPGGGNQAEESGP